MPRRKTPNLALRWGDGTIRVRRTRDGIERFEARWYEQEGGAQPVRRSRTFDTLEEAEAHLRTVGTEKRAGTYTPESRFTVLEAVEELRTRAVRQGRWSPNTAGTNGVLIRRLIAPEIGDYLVARLQHRQLQLWVDGLRGRGVSASSTGSALSIVKNALEELVKMGVIPSNPVQGVSVGKRQPGRDITWTLEETRRVIRTASADPKLHALYLLALTTGMRPGELRALQWGDIDAGEGLVRCQRTVTKDADHQQYVGETTKTRRGRLIAIAPEVVDALQAWRKAQLTHRLAHPAWHDEGIIFDRGDGQFTPESSWQKQHRDLVSSAGVRHISPHSMRHTYATLELEAGTHPEIVRERLGHASIAMTLDRYSHVSTDLQRVTAVGITDRIIDKSA